MVLMPEGVPILLRVNFEEAVQELVQEQLLPAESDHSFTIQQSLEYLF